MSAINDQELVELAMHEAKREGVEFPYRLVMIRQRQHEQAGRFAEANECAAIRWCMELAASMKAKGVQENGTDESR